MTDYDQEHADYLRYRVYRGALERFGDTVPVDDDEYLEYEATAPLEHPGTLTRKRIDHELSIIEEAGYPTYFLIVWDLLRYCRDQGITVGPGRGSVCGSMVAYCLHITDVDPIKYDIPFERFLHLERVAMPDVDMDLCMKRRGEAIQYLRDRYGDDSVAQILAYATMQAKAIIKNVCRVLHVDEILYGDKNNATGERLAAMLPEGSGADQIKLEEYIETDDGQAFWEEFKQVEDAYKEKTGISIWDHCIRLEGLRRHSSSHAAGVVVADRPLVEVAPLYRKNQQAEVQTQYDYKDAESIGLLKVDVLGLRTITVIGEAEKLIREHKDPDFSIGDVPLDDENTYQLLCDGDTFGVFQLEGEGITNAVKGLKPDNIEDILVIIALYRPGPMEQLGNYIRRKHGEEEVRYDHPDLKPILETTYGLIVYQEQIINIAREIGGYTAGEGDVFRKAIGKKIPELIDEQIEKFTEKAVEEGYDLELAEKLGEQIRPAGRYSFNRGHSTGYGLITYWTAYLKANFPTEFYAATLNSYLGKVKRIGQTLMDAEKHGIEVLCPDINESGRGFRMVDEGVIRFGLEAVRGMGDSMIKDLIDERDREEKNEYRYERVTRQRDDGTEYKCNVRTTHTVSNNPRPFDGPADFCSRLSHIPINTKRSLCAAGAFGEEIEYRKNLHAAFEDLNNAAKKGDDFDLDTWKGDRPSDAEMMRFEREAMGFYITTHPLEFYEQEVDRYNAITDGSFEDLPSRFIFAGIVMEIKTHQSRNGPMAWINVETGIRDLPELTVFNNCWSGIRGKVQKDDLIVAEVRKNHHAKFGWGIIAQKVRVVDRARPDMETVMVELPDTDIGDLAKLASRTEEDNGIPVYVGLEEDDRVIVLATTRKVNPVGSKIKKLEEDWDLNADVDGSIGRFPWRGEEYRKRKSMYRGSGASRKAAWEVSIVETAVNLLGGRVIAELDLNS